MATSSFNWVCPTCSRHTTITSPNYSRRVMDVACSVTAPDMGIEVHTTLIECPNTSCRSQSFTISLNRGHRQSGTDSLRSMPEVPVGIGEFTFLPTTAAPLSNYAPASAVEDYNEAYLISGLSPKASATLARRALQGMVRDFFQVRGLRTLHAELEAIKDRCDPALYDAMMAVKSIGNIGAHPDRDINLIIEVEPDEPQALLDLIHLLDAEWYVARAARNERIAKVQALGSSKQATPTGSVPSVLPVPK